MGQVNTVVFREVQKQHINPLFLKHLRLLSCLLKSQGISAAGYKAGGRKLRKRCNFIKIHISVARGGFIVFAPHFCKVNAHNALVLCACHRGGEQQGFQLQGRGGGAENFPELFAGKQGGGIACQHTACRVARKHNVICIAGVILKMFGNIINGRHYIFELVINRYLRHKAVAHIEYGIAPLCKVEAVDSVQLLVAVHPAPAVYVDYNRQFAFGIFRVINIQPVKGVAVIDICNIIYSFYAFRLSLACDIFDIIFLNIFPECVAKGHK